MFLSQNLKLLNQCRNAKLFISQKISVALKRKQIISSQSKSLYLTQFELIVNLAPTVRLHYALLVLRSLLH